MEDAMGSYCPGCGDLCEEDDRRLCSDCQDKAAVQNVARIRNWLKRLPANQGLATAAGIEGDFRSLLRIIDCVSEQRDAWRERALAPVEPRPAPSKPLADCDEQELRELFNAVAQHITAMLPPGAGPNGRAMFALLVFDDPKLAQYVSSCERSCMIEAMRECAGRLEQREDVRR